MREGRDLLCFCVALNHHVLLLPRTPAATWKGDFIAGDLGRNDSPSLLQDFNLQLSPKTKALPSVEEFIKEPPRLSVFLASGAFFDKQLQCQSDTLQSAEAFNIPAVEKWA